MGKVIFYKDYIKRKRMELNLLSYESKKYTSCSSILNRLIDWQMVEI